MKSDRSVPVVIVGAGFSGTMVAAHLARRGIRSLLIEPRDVAGQGTAFSTADPAHLLNVPAGKMSPWPDAPDDFADIAGEGDAFAPRRDYGGYLRAILDDAVSDGATVVRDRALSASKADGGWTVELESGERIGADALVIAIGNQPPDAPAYAATAGERLIGNPWDEQGRAAIADAAANDLDVMIIGTGLTMVDIVLSLDSAGHGGRILALSRRGLAPRSHAASDLAPVELDDVPAGDALALLRWLRDRSGAVGWRAAVDSLRPHTKVLWQGLGVEQQRLFLRHARPWWDVHRHRIAPQVAQQVADRVAAGTLEIAGGRILGMDPIGDGIDVRFRRRGDEAVERRHFGYVFNCTGPLHDIGRTRDPLLRQMLDDGLVRPDQLGIGLAVGDRSQALGADRLWALGALTKGRYWEIIAVPDIRGQAADVAADIATELAQ
ncbi:FAD-dependent oxidoreductase [Sphingomonas sabuli]|uniref:FAD-dependent oxidoreductase n=1 Tax=Sphingomonas sabuli TaxID=2764186 RepID=A0A7G9L236_9SPHN|nr:FAD-dependent oxidoreductase [Sphingomonas sabuli]QNM82685.1 FAD-dependent oxidoreductase [Sphingomonas sabuli]